MMKKLMTCLLALVGVITACGQKNYENTDVKGFAQLLTDSSSVFLLDVRSAQEFGEGHLQGAVNIDQAKDDFIEKSRTMLPQNKTIAVYCRSGRRSANAAHRLAAEGFRVVNLKGGILAWQLADMPTVK